jgi:hypothetical protein
MGGSCKEKEDGNRQHSRRCAKARHGGCSAIVLFAVVNFEEIWRGTVMKEGLWDVMAVLFNVSDPAKRLGCWWGCLREDVLYCMYAKSRQDGREPVTSAFVCGTTEEQKKALRRMSSMKWDVLRLSMLPTLGTEPTYFASPRA